MFQHCICGELLVLTGFDNYKCPKCGIIEEMDFPKELQKISNEFLKPFGGLSKKLYKVGNVICFESYGDDDSNLSYLMSLDDLLNYNSKFLSQNAIDYLLDFKKTHSEDKGCPKITFFDMFDNDDFLIECVPCESEYTCKLSKSLDKNKN